MLDVGTVVVYLSGTGGYTLDYYTENLNIIIKMITFKDIQHYMNTKGVFFPDRHGNSVEYYPVEVLKRHVESMEKGQGILPGTRGAMVMSQRIMRLLKRPEMKKLGHVIEEELLENAKSYYQRMGNKRKAPHRPGVQGVSIRYTHK
jgi:hypothetical protein